VVKGRPIYGFIEPEQVDEYQVPLNRKFVYVIALIIGNCECR